MGAATRVVVLGAGRQALVTAGYFEEAGFEPAVFVEEMPPPYERKVGEYGAPIRTFEDDLVSCSEFPAIAAVGAPSVRQRLVARWEHDEYLTLVSSRAWLASSVVIGPGSTIAPLVGVNRMVRVGSHALVNPGTVLGHDTVVGDFATVGPSCAVAGGVSIGSAAFLGIGCTVIDRIRIGVGAYVAAGAVVVEDVPDGELVMGVPARVVPRPAGLG